MDGGGDFGLAKRERLCGRTLTGRLFNGGGSHSLSAYPVRVVCTMADRVDGMPPAMVLVSVSKRYFKRAVKRNRMKRQLREAYRKNKAIVTEAMEAHDGKTLLMAFMWMDSVERPTAVVEAKMQNLLQRIREQCL